MSHRHDHSNFILQTWHVWLSDTVCFSMPKVFPKATHVIFKKVEFNNRFKPD